VNRARRQAPADDVPRTRPGRLLLRRGVSVSFGWGFAEATLFFLLPDIVVGAVALLHWRRGLRAAGAAIGGAVLGGVCLYAATVMWPGTVGTALDAVPLIPDRFFIRAHEAVSQQGGWAIVSGPSEGVPYKLYVYEWARSGLGAVSLALWTVPARAVRILGTVLIAAVAGAVLRRWFGARREPALLAVYVLCWCAVYVAYVSAVGLS